MLPPGKHSKTPTMNHHVTITVIPCQETEKFGEYQLQVENLKVFASTLSTPSRQRIYTKSPGSQGLSNHALFSRGEEAKHNALVLNGMKSLRRKGSALKRQLPVWDSLRLVPTITPLDGYAMSTAAIRDKSHKQSSFKNEHRFVLEPTSTVV